MQGISFFAAQFALVPQLAVAGRVRAWTPVLVMADLLLPFFEKDLIPLGALFLLVSFAPLARRSAAAVPTAPTTPAAAVSR
ncbi:hypothetical protein Ppa06_61280 [Planomonospora parontospora subsp. parontospora]|uniref:Uncharacterized protein n=2 Tax=Planomonospora parontospora TaxID=58119 RepID=A0AA37BEY5_9ACTN|nr:hypothetical protein [Planomonospora parontospora]GGK62256.1 hypothetical protein GCM10010126_22080 [Planomonospora parontospora]GII12330.1 hypothetical protein Ppa06_61280 [Planomonospora parontospora subsp. parontospora]